MKKLHEIARNSATAEIFKIMASDQKSKETLDRIKALTDEQLDTMADIGGIPDVQKLIYRALIRGDDNELIQKLNAFEDKLETGDVILMTGTSKSSKILANSQKTIYTKARSSHIALVHADFICIDAIPKAGVTNRLISQILSDVEDDWRVIRFNRVDEKNHETIHKVCAYYLAQPYMILPSKKPAKNFSYCSELARKVYLDSDIQNCHIPKNIIIKPCDFDRIADNSNDWTDVTERVRPFIEFCKEYEPLLKIFSKLFINGLKLNRARSEERKNAIRAIKAAAANGEISNEKASEMIKIIHQTEKSMNFKFWDSEHSSHKEPVNHD
mgnify:CR=1 FL=1